MSEKYPSRCHLMAVNQLPHVQKNRCVLTSCTCDHQVSSTCILYLFNGGQGNLTGLDLVLPLHIFYMVDRKSDSKQLLSADYHVLSQVIPQIGWTSDRLNWLAE